MKSAVPVVGGRNRLKSAGLSLGAVAASILLAACSASGDGAGRNVLDRSHDVASAAWELIVDPIAQPEVADGVALVYAKGKALSAIAVSAADGKQLWSRPIHPGIGAPGIELQPALTKTTAGTSVAIFLQPASAPADSRGISWWTAPVAVDLKTGKDVYRGAAQLVTSRPAACGDGKDMCFTSLDVDTNQSVEHRVDLATGRDLSGRHVNPLTGSFRLVGDDLYSVVEGGKESLARVSGGKKLWAVDVKTLFGAGATTDFGWTFNYSKKLDLYVGTVGSNPTKETDYAKLMKKGFTVDLTKRKTVGFSASTGKALWAAEGAETWCSSTQGKTATRLEGGEALPVRCEFTRGSQKIPGGAYSNAMARLVGYDPLTGEAVWHTDSQAITEEKSLIVPTISNGDSMVAGGKDGWKLIDTRSGASRPTTSEDVFLCTKPAKYPLPANSPFTTLPQGNTGSGGDIAVFCHKDGKDASALTAGAVKDINNGEGDIAVVSLQGKISGYKRR